MRIIHTGVLLTCAPLLLVSAAAVGGLNGVNITITNDHPEDVMVTVYDMTLQPSGIVLSQRINGFARIPVSLAADASGRGNVAWTAVTIDPDHRRCGHESRPGLAASTSVHVRADSECAGS